MILDFSQLDSTKRYKLISQTVVPRPIAWIVTEDEGIINIAPFSYFTPLSSDPATVVVSIGHKSDGSKKDTLANILKTKKATICFVREEDKDLMNSTGEDLDKSVSEAEHFEKKKKRVQEDFPPMIEGVESALFCKFHSSVELTGRTVPIILEIQSGFYKNITEDLKVDLSNIGRYGREYCRLTKI